MTGGEPTLGTVPARLEERELEITAQAETIREQVAQLTAQLDEPGRAAEDVRLTRKTLLGLPDPGPPAPPTPKQDWVLLEPGVDVLAHLVPAEYRWIGLSDGRVTVYAVCPPDSSQRCRIEHRLACPGQQLPDLWPWLTALRGENARRAEREANAEPPVPVEVELPDVG